MTRPEKADVKEKTTTDNNKDRIQCGLIMPISSIDGCSSEHWVDIKNIISDSVRSISELDIQVSLVSDANDIGVIQC